MADNPDRVFRTARSIIITGKALNRPSGRKVKHLHQLEAEAARRRWLLTAAGLLVALVVGVLIGRFLLP